MVDIIEEIPIVDAPENDALVGGGEDAPSLEPVLKKRGRPKGSVNRAKAAVAKPKPETKSKPKPKIRRPPTPEESEEEKTPPPRKRRVHRQQDFEESPDSVSPEQPTSRDIAAEVLHLLSNRHVQTKVAKREKYASWFQ